MTLAAARETSLVVARVAAGAALIALGIGASLQAQSWIVAAFAGAGGLALWRGAVTAAPISPILPALDALAFATFAVMRNDAVGFWQLPGPWADVPHFNVSGALIAYCVYVCGSLAALLSRYRGLRAIEAIGLIAIPFLFNLVMVLGADWHMQELGAWLSPDAPRAFQGQVLIGRIAILFFVSEVLVLGYSTVATGRPATSPRLHILMFVGAGLAALTPLAANFAQTVSQPFLAIGFGAILAALALAPLWAIVYVMTGLTLDLLGGRPPTFRAAYDHWRAGFVKGAI